MGEHNSDARPYLQIVRNSSSYCKPHLQFMRHACFFIGIGALFTESCTPSSPTVPKGDDTAATSSPTAPPLPAPAPSSENTSSGQVSTGEGTGKKEKKKNVFDHVGTSPERLAVLALKKRVSQLQQQLSARAAAQSMAAPSTTNSPAEVQQLTEELAALQLQQRTQQDELATALQRLHALEEQLQQPTTTTASAAQQLATIIEKVLPQAQPTASPNNGPVLSLQPRRDSRPLPFSGYATVMSGPTYSNRGSVAAKEATQVANSEQAPPAME